MKGRIDPGRITHIFFDADDTLWCNEEFFREAEQRFARRISSAVPDIDRTVETVTRRQEENIRLFGYGSKTFLLSMLDTAEELCPQSFDAALYRDTKQIILSLAYHEFTLIDGVEEVLESLCGRFTLVMATKGDPAEQLYKFRVSGLERYFSHSEVMRDKSPDDYLALTGKLGIEPGQMLMVGNAVKSDIAPVIQIGGTAVHIPYKVSWPHEMMEMPRSDRIFELKSIKELPALLSAGPTA